MFLFLFLCYCFSCFIFVYFYYLFNSEYTCSLARSTSDSNLNFDPEIDLTLRALRREQRQKRENQLNRMAQLERRTLSDFAMPDISGSFGGIVAPAIANNNFEIKPSIIQMVQNNQFGDLQGEDPYAHILTFLNMCATFKINGVTDDAIRLRLFLFSSVNPL